MGLRSKFLGRPTVGRKARLDQLDAAGMYKSIPNHMTAKQADRSRRAGQRSWSRARQDAAFREFDVNLARKGNGE